VFDLGSNVGFELADRAALALSADGRRVLVLARHFHSQPATAYEVYTCDTQTCRTVIVEPSGAHRDSGRFAIDASGTCVAFESSATGDREVWLADLSQGTLTNVSRAEGADFAPILSEDGRSVAFLRHGGTEIVVAEPDHGAAATRVVATGSNGRLAMRFLANGRVLCTHPDAPETFIIDPAGGTRRDLEQLDGENLLGVSPDARRAIVLRDGGPAGKLAIIDLEE